MSRVITFSKTFPAYHPKAGQPTFFVEKLWAWLADNTDHMQGNLEMDWYEYYNCILPKHHTIRTGNRRRVGDTFSPRIWSGKPYRSPQIIIAPDIEIKKVWDITIEGESVWIKRGKNRTHVDWAMMHVLAANDGVTLEDLKAWFKMPCDRIEAQIICWNDKIEY